MTLPNFLVIGAMKAGTTSLNHYLGMHPQVFMSPRKEPHFFVKGVVRPHGVNLGWEQGWKWYEDLFAGAGDAVAVGEASTSYTAYPARTGVPARIAEALPQVRLVYLLRNPVERARSEYIHKWIVGREGLPIGTALLENPVYLDKSRYALQIEQYLAHFAREQLILVVSEELRADRAATMRPVWEFLGVEATKAPGNLGRELNRTESKEAVSARLRLARRIPGYAGVARRSPRLVQAAYRGAIRSRHDIRQVTIPDEVRTEMESRLRPDLERLRVLAPAAVERWAL